MSVNDSENATQVTQDPLKMIQKFAANYSIPPETISDIFVAGLVQFKAAGRLPMDACPVVHYTLAPPQA